MPLLVSLQPRQFLRAGENAEQRELGERPGMHPGGGGEDHPPEFFLGEVRRLHLRAAAGGHDVHPLEFRVGSHDAGQFGRVVIGEAVQDVGAVDQFGEPGLLLGRPLEARVAPMIGRPPHRGHQVGFVTDLDSGIGGPEPLDVLTGQRFRNHYTQIVHSALHRYSSRFGGCADRRAQPRSLDCCSSISAGTLIGPEERPTIGSQA
ncbi:hypothetical protein SDC9_145083 [bioreactor metagenome]|uniref:Uncharacterized protein n=1 Tax=bioreactor metagenome TaxID=1076179 RepID=A0A645EAQ1_9ZZZZ